MAWLKLVKKAVQVTGLIKRNADTGVLVPKRKARLSVTAAAAALLLAALVHYGVDPTLAGLLVDLLATLVE
jgi:hypothetical protein